MKKTLIVASIFACLAAVKADTLWWQVEPGIYGWDTAELLASTSQDKSNPTFLAAVAANSDSRGLYTDPTATSLDSLQNPSDYYFFVELVNYTQGGQLVKSNWAWSYSELLSSGYIQTSPMGTTYTGGGMNGAAAVPEPTSGLLLLIGGSLLALRRRRRA